jgi:hypothetical protein
MTERTRVLIEIDEPMGPGVDFEPNVDGIGSTARRARLRGPWLGLDRGHLVDADDGSGREVPVLVAVPASTFAGCRIEGDLVGGLAVPGGSVLVARISGAALPIEPFIRTAAGRLASEGSWMSAQDAARHAERARRQYRERRAKERVVGGRAWLPEGSEAPEQARFSTPHSLSEYSLARLPPRFVRGLEGLLDSDERILYWIERPGLVDSGLVERVRRQRDRRAAMLLLTDRQVAWLVDHAAPDRYLSDWGVDVISIPNEQLVDIEVTRPRGEPALVVVRTSRGATEVRLPGELSREATVFRDLASGFASRSSALPRRRYATERIEPDWAMLEPFGSGAEARQIAVGLNGEVLGYLPSPRRPGQARTELLAVSDHSISVVSAAGSTHEVSIDRMHSLEATFSTLRGRIATTGEGRVAITYPSTLGASAAPIISLVRRLVANS